MSRSEIWLRIGFGVFLRGCGLLSRKNLRDTPSMGAFSEFVQWILGLDVSPEQLSFLQISMRAVIIFLAALVMVRISSTRSLAEKTAFDAVLIVIIASLLSRCINGPAPFFETIGTGFVLVALHRSFAIAAFYSHGFGYLIKGKADTLIQDGKLEMKNLRRNHISVHDIEQDMRLHANTDDMSHIKLARVERSGEISFVKRDKKT